MKEAALVIAFVIGYFSFVYALNWQGGHNCVNHWPDASYSFIEGCRINDKPAHTQ